MNVSWSHRDLLFFFFKYKKLKKGRRHPAWEKTHKNGKFYVEWLEFGSVISNIKKEF